MKYTLEQLKRNWRTDLHPEHLMDASGVISELFQELEARDQEIACLKDGRAISVSKDQFDDLNAELDRLRSQVNGASK